MDHSRRRVGSHTHRLGCVQDSHNGSFPPCMATIAALFVFRRIDKETRISGARVVIPAQLQERSERVELVFTLKDHSRVVRWENEIVRVAVVAGGHFGLGGRLEGVAVWTGEEVAGLEVDGAAEEGSEFGRGRWAGGGRLLRRGVEEGDVGLELVGAVAEPHGVDVAGGDEGELESRRGPC